MKKVMSIILVAMMLFSTMTVSVSAATYSESESNDSYSTADTLSSGNTIKGELSSSSDIDYYKIATSSNGKLTIKFNHKHNSENGYWVVKTYYYTGSKYNVLSTNYIYLSDSEIITLPSIGAVSGGTYYVSVDYGSNSTLIGYDYSVSASFSSTSYYEREMNNSYQTATTISSGYSYGGNMYSSDDIDYFKFTAPSNGSINVSFGHSHSSTNGYWVVKTFYYSNGTYNLLSTEYMYLSDNESIDLPAISAVSGGTYYVSVDYGSSSDLVGYNYTVTADFNSSNYYEREMNNSYQTATNISTGSSYSGCLYSYDDIDYYKLTASSKGEISLSFSHLYNSSSGYWCVYVYSYSGGTYTKLSTNYVYVNGNSTIDLTPISATANGVYFIVVDYGSNVEGLDYSIIAKSSSSSTTTYTLSYNANGGSGEPSSQTGKTTYTISSTIPTRSGYTFLGWSKSSSATSATYDAGDKITLTSNTTLYAVWKKNSTAKPTITLSDSRINVKVGESVTVVANCNKNGSDVRRTVNYSIKNTSVVSAEWVEWQGDDAYLKIHGVSEGTTTITITLTNTDTKEVYDTAEISVNVTEENKNSGNDNTSTSGEFSFMDILNAIAGFFTWLFSAIASLFA